MFDTNVFPFLPVIVLSMISVPKQLVTFKGRCNLLHVEDDAPSAGGAHLAVLAREGREADGLAAERAQVDQTSRLSANELWNSDQKNFLATSNWREERR